MLRNYLKIAFRNLSKYRFISFINLFGLTIGLSCCLLILSYILNELSYDKFNKKADRIYRVDRSWNNSEGVTTLRLGAVAPPIGPLLKNDFPDIEKVTRLLPVNNTTFRYEEKVFNEPHAFFADEHFMDVFTVHLVEGNPATVLSDPFSVMLTPEMAHKYFGSEDPVNKTLRANNQFDVKVTGIFSPFPANAHLHPEILISFNTLKDSAVYGAKKLETNWGNNAFFTYLLMPEGYPVRQLETRFPDFLDNHMNDGMNPANKPSKYTSLQLQKLTDIHLRSHLDEEIEENGDFTRVVIFSAIALFILLIACINYMNLSTARSTLRAREIGIRKVSGALRREIILQFLVESVLISLMAAVLAVGLTRLALPWLSDLTGQTLTSDMLLQIKVLIPLLFTPIVVGLIAGLYPALFMSAFQPARVLKGLFKTAGGNLSLRKILVVTQFSISIILIIATGVVFCQLRFIHDSALGLDKEHVLTLRYDTGLTPYYQTFRNELLQSTDVRALTRSSRIPSGRLLDEDDASMESGDSLRPVNADVKFINADAGFAPTYQIPFAAGRNFSRDFATDTSAFVLNESAVRVMGIPSPQGALGKTFRYGDHIGKIIGVLRDFHFESMHQPILPLVLVMRPDSEANNSYASISIKISGAHMPGTIAYIEKTWKKFLPESPFEYSFLDQKYDELYRSEERQGTLFTIFACIAIFIACLGLLGLSSFAISQRIKEIGIRKVLGATTAGIVGLVSKDFLKLVMVSAFIAFPIAGYAMYRWLQGFAYRTPIPWWVFLLAAILAGFVALLTISLQAFRAAMANPVKSLRTE